MVDKIVVDRVDQFGQLGIPSPFRLATDGIEENIQVEGQYLGDKMPGMLGGEAGVVIVAVGHRQETEQAQRLHDHRLAITVAQVIGGQQRLEDLRRRPVGSGKDTATLQITDTVIDHGHGSRGQQQAPRRVQDPAGHLALGEGPGLFEFANPVVKLLDEPLIEIGFLHSRPRLYHAGHRKSVLRLQVVTACESHIKIEFFLVF